MSVSAPSSCRVRDVVLHASPQGETVLERP
jgi:hypothetical protein